MQGFLDKQKIAFNITVITPLIHILEAYAYILFIHLLVSHILVDNMLPVNSLYYVRLGLGSIRDHGTKLYLTMSV